MAIAIDTRTGPVVNSDGPGDQALRQGRYGALIVSDAHARYEEATYRGNTFTIVSTGITTLQGIASPLTTGGTGFLTLYNPSGSGKAAVVSRGGLIYVSAGTGLAGGTYQLGWSWCYTVAAASTVATTITPLPNLLVSVNANSAMRGWGISALSLANPATQLRPGVGFVTSSSTANALAFGGTFALEETAGDIVVPPGTFLHLMPNTTSTTATAWGSITYEEVVYP